MKIEELIGKEINLFPRDTYYKFAILLEISDKGYLFKITDCHKDSGYKASEIVFFNNSCNVTFKFKQL